MHSSSCKADRFKMGEIVPYVSFKVVLFTMYRGNVGTW